MEIEATIVDGKREKFSGVTILTVNVSIKTLGKGDEPEYEFFSVNIPRWEGERVDQAWLQDKVMDQIGTYKLGLTTRWDTDAKF